MTRSLFITVLALAAAIPAVAQQHQHQHQHGSDHAAHKGGEFPPGWSARTDRDAALDNVRFMAHGDGFHAVTGSAAVFYNPEWRKSGDYRVAARLTQTKATQHPEAYGIVFGGRSLSDAGQTYSYFLVRQTGEYFIATRKGAERTKVVDWTAHPAIRKPDESGRAANLLGVEVAGEQVVFRINGTEVTRLPKSQLETDGLIGFRINHHLDVMIDQITR